MEDREMKKRIASFMATVMMVLASGSLAYAAEEQNATQAVEQAQTYSWVQEGQVWKVKDILGNYVVNDWFKDANGNWYFMGADGVMIDGIINDGGHYYFLETRVENQGKMVTVNGVYNGVNLTFNQDVNSITYGEITGGLQQLIGTGVQMTSLTTVTTRTVSNAPVGGTQQQVQAPAQQTVDFSNPFADWDTHGDNVKMGDWGDTSDIGNYADWKNKGY